MADAAIQITPTMGFLRIGTTRPTTSAYEAAKVYDFNQFDPTPGGRATNIFGVTNGWDDDTVTAVMAQIKADLKAYTDPNGFAVQIVFRSPSYRTQRLADFTIPNTPDFNPSAKPGVTPTCVMIHMTLDFLNETHWYLSSSAGGLVVGGWDMRSRLRTRGHCNLMVQTNMPFAFRRTNTNGSTALDFARVTGPSGFFPNVDPVATPLRGVTNVEIDGMNVFDSYGAAAKHAVWIESGIVAKLRNIHVYSTPGPIVGNSPCLPGSSAILIDGFSIQVWVDDNLNEYKEDTIRLIGYTESFQWRNAGGSNCYRSLHVDKDNFNYPSCYPSAAPTPANPAPGPGQFGLAWCVDQFSQLDATGCVFDLTLVDIIRIYGGYYWQHAVGGGCASDGVSTGDFAGGCGMVFRGCVNVQLYNAEFGGPSEYGAPCVNGGKAVWMTAAVFTAADQARPGGPVPQTIPSQHLQMSNPKFTGYGHNPAKPPVVIDGGIFGVTVDNARWWMDNADGLMAASPVADPSGKAAVTWFAGDGALGSSFVTNGIATLGNVAETKRVAASFYAQVVGGQPINGPTVLKLGKPSGGGAGLYDATRGCYVAAFTGKHRILAAIRLPDVSLPALTDALTGSSTPAQIATAFNHVVAAYNAMLSTEQRVALGVDTAVTANQDQWSQFNVQSTFLHLVVERYYNAGDTLYFLAFANQATTVSEGNGFVSVEYVGG